MIFLYSCYHSGDQYRITKFSTPDFNVESSYLCDATGCDCPAGHRPTCRHREMLPKFLAREAVGTQWMYDYDRGGWVQAGLEQEPERVLPSISGSQTLPANSEPPLAAAGRNHSSPSKPSLEISPLTTEQWREGIGHATIEIASAASAAPAEQPSHPSPPLLETPKMFNWSTYGEEPSPSPKPQIRRRV